jgi:phosphoglycerate dehydrogenase-like enzyme
LLAFTRGFPHYMDRQRERAWAGRHGDVPLDELSGKTLLIVGLGGIGHAIAQRAAAFGMTVLATDPKVFEKPLCVAELHTPERLDNLIPRADVVASAAPLTSQTRRLFNADRFESMKRGAVFLNVSRGGLVHTDALVAALASGHLVAAGLDVTDPEPLPSDHPLWSVPNVIITPHSAGQSPGGLRRRHELFRENLRRFAAGEMLLNIVDKHAGY